MYVQSLRVGIFIGYTLFFIRTSKFWPSLVVLRFLHNLSLNCSLKSVLVSSISIIHFDTVMKVLV